MGDKDTVTFSSAGTCAIVTVGDCWIGMGVLPCATSTFIGVCTLRSKLPELSLLYVPIPRPPYWLLPHAHNVPSFFNAKTTASLYENLLTLSITSTFLANKRYSDKMKNRCWLLQSRHSFPMSIRCHHSLTLLKSNLDCTFQRHYSIPKH